MSESDEIHDEITRMRGVLAANLEARTKELELSWPELEKRAGVSRTQIYFIRTSKKSASLDVLTKLALALEIEPFELIK